MKKLALIAMAFLVFSCKKESPKKESIYPETPLSVEEKQMALGEEIFNGKGNCFACHKPDQKIIGPSLQEIVQIYKDKKGNMYDFLKNDAEPIVDPTQYGVMKTNFAITKCLSEEELNALITYVYSHN